jgi:non-lysosomal glucosylceramidase
LLVLACLLLFLSAARTHAQDEIPNAAWRRPIGLPLENPGVTRVAGDIETDIGKAPVGGRGISPAVLKSPENLRQ